MTRRRPTGMRASVFGASLSTGARTVVWRIRRVDTGAEVHALVAEDSAHAIARARTLDKTLTDVALRAERVTP